MKKDWKKHYSTDVIATVYEWCIQKLFHLTVYLLDLIEFEFPHESRIKLLPLLRYVLMRVSSAFFFARCLFFCSSQSLTLYLLFDFFLSFLSISFLPHLRPPSVSFLWAYYCSLWHLSLSIALSPSLFTIRCLYRRPIRLLCASFFHFFLPISHFPPVHCRIAA